MDGPTIDGPRAADAVRDADRAGEGASGGLTLRPPVGAIRNPLTVVLLSVITLGIYGLWWTCVMFRDTREFGAHGIGGLGGLVLAVFLPVLPPFLLPWQIGRIRTDAGLERRTGAVYGLWWLLPIVGWIVWVYATQRAVNELWEANGATI